jgi:hypothetical protein
MNGRTVKIMKTVYLIQINYPIRCNSLKILLLDVYVSLNMYRAPPRPSSGAYNCINSLWFYRWSENTTNNAATTKAPTVKPEDVNAVVSS